MPNSPSLIQLIVVLVVLGVVWHVVERYLPVAEPFRVILRVVIVIALLLYVLRFFGIV
jgi:hypothetical protein